MLLRERQELLCKLAHHIAVEGHAVRDAKTEEDGEQQQRIFRRLAERFGLLDQQTCPLRSSLSFQRGIAFDMEKRVYERDLKLDLFAAQRWCWRERRDLRECPRKLAYCFNEGRAFQRPVSRLAPKARCPLDQASLGAMTRQQFGLVLGNLQ